MYAGSEVDDSIIREGGEIYSPGTPRIQICLDAEEEAECEDRGKISSLASDWDIRGGCIRAPPISGPPQVGGPPTATGSEERGNDRATRRCVSIDSGI